MITFHSFQYHPSKTYATSTSKIIQGAVVTVSVRACVCTCVHVCVCVCACMCVCVCVEILVYLCGCMGKYFCIRCRIDIVGNRFYSVYNVLFLCALMVCCLGLLFIVLVLILSMIRANVHFHTKCL